MAKNQKTEASQEASNKDEKQTFDVIGQKLVKQLANLKEIVTTEDTYVFKFSKRDVVGFDESAKKVLYGEVQKKEVSVTKIELSELFLSEIALKTSELVDKIEHYENQQVVGMLYKKVVSIVRAKINPFNVEQ